MSKKTRDSKRLSDKAGPGDHALVDEIQEMLAGLGIDPAEAQQIAAGTAKRIPDQDWEVPAWLRRIPPLTMNQVVAHNLSRARTLRGWTQEVAAGHLSRFLPGHVRWSRATFSVAEQSVNGVRIREFTADDIFAFARAFELPVSYFFLPPVGVDVFTTVGIIEPNDHPAIDPDDEFSTRAVLDLLFGATDDLTARLRELLAGVPLEERDELARQYTVAAWRDALEAVEASVGSVEEIRSRLAGVVALLDALAPAVRRESGAMIDDATRQTAELLASPRRYEAGG